MFTHHVSLWKYLLPKWSDRDISYVTEVAKECKGIEYLCIPMSSSEVLQYFRNKQ